jgi:hypothetical protein
MKLTTFATCFAAVTAAVTAAAALAPSEARATTYSGTGWVQLQKSASDSAATTIEGNDFAIGYTAYFALEGYNWDVAGNTVSVSCVSYDVFSGLFTVTESECATLPGTLQSSSTASSSTTYGGLPATKKTTTLVWDVPDVGALGRLDGYFSLPVTLFDEDFDLFKLTGTATGNTHGNDDISAGVYVVGAKIAGGTASLPASARVVEECVTLVEVEAEYALVGIPITVSASSDGCIYVDVSASWGGRTLTGTLTPGASVDATVKAGVGADIGVASAEAGVYGSITVVDASVPVSLSAAIVAGGVTVTESVKLTMTGMDGEVGLYAEACVLFFGCEDDSLTLFDWTGLTYANTTLFSASQTINY